MRTWHWPCMKCAFGQSNARSGSRCLPVWHMEACRRRAFRSAYGGLLKKLVLFAIRKPVERCGARGLAEKCALFGVWDLSDLSESVPCSAYSKPVEGMHSFRRWQKTPQWGPIAWIWGRAARKRHVWGLFWADILRLSFRKIT